MNYFLRISKFGKYSNKDISVFASNGFQLAKIQIGRVVQHWNHNLVIYWLKIIFIRSIKLVFIMVIILDEF